MQRFTLFLLLIVSIFVGRVSAQISKLNTLTNPTLDELRENFKQPDRNFSTGPLWTWNDRLTEAQVRETLRDLAGQNVKQVWVHPRPGLMTPYLSDEWFTMWKFALDEAEKLDMNVWIYDENSYPSGFAGGFVPEAMPESRGMELRFHDLDKHDNINDNIWYVFKPVDGGYENITEEAKKAGKVKPLESGQRYFIVSANYSGAGGWFGGWWYVDLLKSGVTEKFIELTFEAYKNIPEIRKEFGRRVPGIFTDEPHLIGSFHWNDEIPGLFEKKFGYSLVDNIPSLAKPIGDWKKIRHNYHALLMDLFAERWCRKCFEWCESNGLEFTGHYWEHGWPGTSHGPDNMAMYIWHQRPAIDLLMNGYDDGSSGAQFGNVRSVKELASIANQLGRSRTLSENYGAGGWDLRFEDMKRLGDWSYALGVNTNNEHLSYVTIRGARKRDHPQSFSYHAGWFEGYHVLADYFTRLSYVLSQGRQVNRVVVIEPTTTAWMYQHQSKLGEIARSFTDLVNSLERSHAEYDLASEDTIARLGAVDGKEFSIHLGKYDLVILPPNMENINGNTAKLLEQYIGNGGRLLCAGEWPTRIDGTEAAWMKTIPDNAKMVSPDEAVSAAKKRTSEDGLCIDAPEDTKSIFHHRRRLKDAEVLFLCNADPNESVPVEIKTDKVVFECWNPQDAEQAVSVAAGDSITVSLPPSGSALFVLSDTLTRNFPATETESVVVPGSEMTAKRLEPNVLTIDYVDVKIGDEEKKDIYAWQANRWIFQKHGFGANPWDNQVQFRDQLITKTFPEGSGFEAVYRFTIEEKVPSDLKIAIERSDLYKITCNDEPGTVSPDAWWLDKSFGVIDLSKVAKIGENEIKITASPMTIYHELEPVYLLGNFSLKNIEKGFVVVPAKPLQLDVEEDMPADLRHSDGLERISWLSAGVDFKPGRSGHVDDRAPTLTFGFGDAREIAGVRVWNYCERNLEKRGVKEIDISGDKVELARGHGLPEEILFDSPKRLKTVEFKIRSNHAGTTYPIPENAKPEDNGFVGLAEVQFLALDPGNPKKLVPLKGVTVKASSELVVDSHDRRAKYLVSGSGLGEDGHRLAWSRQGMPFYSGKVAYTRTFDITETASKERFFVQLPSSPGGWYGATAQIMVNGQSAGFVISSPWQIDVAKWIRPGQNEISVRVIGTPKNLLGPHHVGRHRGSAWPGSFHHAPGHQPNGAAYDVIDYGLYEPFILKRDMRQGAALE